MEGVQGRVQEAINGLIGTLDKEHLRKLQAQMYKCSAACCENPHYNMEDAQRCVERCSVPVNKSQNYLQTELSSFQDRLQRCAMDCQDKVRDKVDTNTTEAMVSKYRGEFESCVVKCGDSHIALVPSMLKKMKDVLSQHESGSK